MEPAIPISPLTEENRTLMEQVRPSGWLNPVPADCYNLVVIGAGTAGLVCAAGAAGLGARVALVERHLLGGDCLNYGCVPSKGIIRSARSAYEARHSAEFGIGGGEGIAVDFGRAMERMRKIRAEISPHDSARRFRDELGVDIFFGDARFTGTDTVEVAGSTLRFRKAAVCTGARAMAPPIPGIEEAGYLTNETVFSLTELPQRLVVIGSGPIGCEMAQTFARLGSKVTLLERGDHILPREDRDAAGIVHDAFLRDGIDICLRTATVGAASRGTSRTVTVERDGVRREIETDAILVGIGRAPNVEGLGLEVAGIAYDVKFGVKVNDRLQTGNPQVYAAGDICFPYKFTHTADAMARILIANALFLGRQRASALVIPWCIYTDPEVAHVGLYEEDARGKGIDVITLTVPLAEVDRALLDGEAAGFARVHLKKGSDTILGATIVARHAGEMISELTLAMTSGLGLGAIGRTIHPYPTQAEAVRKLADAWNRTRLTPFVKKVLGVWLTWQRGRR
jgi:pyruvate/2-oxoglutarate dehydrogenase complex dihydrolipoamide dehydrogenase (E3) component